MVVQAQFQGGLRSLGAGGEDQPGRGDRPIGIAVDLRADRKCEPFPPGQDEEIVPEAPFARAGLDMDRDLGRCAGGEAEGSGLAGGAGAVAFHAADYERDGGGIGQSHPGGERAILRLAAEIDPAGLEVRLRTGGGGEKTGREEERAHA